MIRRNTNQRKIVYDTLHHLGHASSEQLISYIQSNYSNISLATIYRNLGILMDEQMVKKVKLDGIDIYETVKSKHFHFVCKHCGEITDITPHEIKVDFTSIKSINSDTVDEVDVTFYGMCSKCKSTINN